MASSLLLMFVCEVSWGRVFIMHLQALRDTFGGLACRASDYWISIFLLAQLNALDTICLKQICDMLCVPTV
jgi:hypothetical protein